MATSLLRYTLGVVSLWVWYHSSGGSAVRLWHACHTVFGSIYPVMVPPSPWLTSADLPGIRSSLCFLGVCAGRRLIGCDEVDSIVHRHRRGGIVHPVLSWSMVISRQCLGSEVKHSQFESRSSKKKTLTCLNSTIECHCKSLIRLAELPIQSIHHPSIILPSSIQHPSIIVPSSIQHPSTINPSIHFFPVLDPFSMHLMASSQ